MANTAGAIQRITKEIANVQKNEDLSIAVAFRDSDVRRVRGLIVGPPDTPYEFGFFEFDMKFPKEYPLKSPSVQCITTNSGQTRFNPNVYAEGKVCLSILGTWRGEPGEQWSSAQGLESVLLSIQSLLSPNPYENEPGYEDVEKEEPMAAAYIAKIRHETIRISVLQRLESLLKLDPFDVKRSRRSLKRRRSSESETSTPVSTPSSGKHTWSSSSTSSTTSVPAQGADRDAASEQVDDALWDPFADVLKQRFLWFYDNYMRNITIGMQGQRDDTPFESMDFEYPNNTMDGFFEHELLRKRMCKVLEALHQEKRDWAKRGATLANDGDRMANQLDFHFKQLSDTWNVFHKGRSRLEFNLPQKGNPFHWNITLFGRPDHNLDEGIFSIDMHIPPDFPESQPRVQFLTPIFHHRVSPTTGALCYFPERPDDICSHVEAIVVAVEDENPKYDPRATVNWEASQLYWGKDQRKVYNSRLRRSAQDSCGA